MSHESVWYSRPRKHPGINGFSALGSLTVLQVHMAKALDNGMCLSRMKVHIIQDILKRDMKLAGF
jgi:hypothetical protein